jgi:bifunctional DNA-binding transcriptional regulator/antitoxin component of YhaV-PrlF toxin-antitoxin module
MEDGIVKMSPKGQLVVPQFIREEEDFSPGDRFVAVSLSEGVLFKKVEMPKVKIEFQKLAREIEAQFKKNKVSDKVVGEAVACARRK